MSVARVLLVLLLCSCARSTPEEGAQTQDRSVQEVVAYRACDFSAPGELVPLPREVAADADPVAAAIRTVLEGVNDEERDRGCTSFFSDQTANALRGVSRTSDGDTIAVDFWDLSKLVPDVPGATSFLPPGVLAELTWTIFAQFPEIEAVRFSFDGSEQAFWNWVGGPGTDAQVYTREMWGEI